MASVKPRNATPPSSSVTGSPIKTLFRVLAVLAVGATLLLPVSPVRCRYTNRKMDPEGNTDESGVTNQWEGKMHAAFVKEFAASSTEVSTETVQKEGGNAPSGAMLFAPQVILEVLALLREGAKGKTRDELDNFLGSPEVFDGKQEALKGLVDQLNNVKDAGVEFRYGSAIFVDQTVDGDEKYKAYEKRVQRKYAAVPQLADFAKAPEAAAAKINKFVDEKTSGRISQLVDKSAITKDLKLVVASAMFFKGKWAFPFEKKKTRPGNFTTIATESGKKTRVTVPNVQFMHREFKFSDENKGFSFSDTSEVTTMVLPYEAKGWSMAFVMPKDPLKFEAFESDPMAIKKHISEARSNEEWAKDRSNVLVSVPKFRIEAEMKEITPILSELGMSTMFSNTADFSGMSEQFRLKVGKFVTSAMIEVVEEGTTAAAVAGAMMMLMSMPRLIVLDFNQPFIAAVLYTPPKANSAEEITLFQLRITNPLPLQKEFKETW